MSRSLFSAAALTWLALLLWLLVSTAHSAPRSPAVLRAFRRDHPCPATGLTTGKCKGWKMDHAVPLCWDPKGDVVENLIWEEEAQSYRKDTFERAACALRERLKKLEASKP